MRKIKFILAIICVTQLIIVNQMFAATSPQIITHSTTEVLQETLLSHSTYLIGMGIGEMPSHTAKPWKIHTAPEMAYVLTGQVTVNFNHQYQKTFKKDDSYQIPIHVLHQAVAGPKGFAYIAFWGMKRGEKIAYFPNGTTPKSLPGKIDKLAIEKSIARNFVINGYNKTVLQKEKIPHSPYQVSLALVTIGKKQKHDFQLSHEPQLIYVLQGEMVFKTKKIWAKKYHYGDSYLIPKNTSYQIIAGKQGVRYLLGSAYSA